MEWMIDDGDVRIANGDALEQLRQMPECSVQMIASSPPFWLHGASAITAPDDGKAATQTATTSRIVHLEQNGPNLV